VHVTMFSTGRKFCPASIFTRPYSSHPFLCALVQNYTGKYPEFFASVIVMIMHFKASPLTSHTFADVW